MIFKIEMFALFYPVLHKEKQKKTNQQQEQQNILELINTLNSQEVLVILAFCLCGHDIGLNQTLTTSEPNLTHYAFSGPAVVNLFNLLIIKLSQVVKWAAFELVYWEFSLEDKQNIFILVFLMCEHTLSRPNEIVTFS